MSAGRFLVIRDHQHLRILHGTTVLNWFHNAICQFNVAAPALAHLCPKIWQHIYGLCNISTQLFPCGQWNSVACLQRMIISKLNAEKLSWIFGPCHTKRLLSRLESQGPENIVDQVHKLRIDEIFVEVHNTARIKAAAMAQPSRTWWDPDSWSVLRRYMP